MFRCVVCLQAAPRISSSFLLLPVSVIMIIAFDGQRLSSAEVWKFRCLRLEQSELLNSMSRWTMKTGEYERDQS